VVRVDDLTVDSHLEDGVVALEQLRRDAELALDGSRQTGGPTAVTSLDAVRDI
jgi:hypothetical protein